MTGGHVEGEGADVLQAHHDLGGALDEGMDAAAFPMLLQGIDDHPVHAVVAQVPGGEMHVLRIAVTAEGADVSEAFLDLDAPVARVTMPDIPSPHHPDLMEWALPSVARIRAKIDQLLAF